MSSRPDRNDRAPPYAWYGLAVLFIIYMVNFIDRQILSILANDIKADLAIGDAELGFLYGTAFAIFYALFGIPLGRLADRWNRTRLLGLGLALWSAMTMLSGLAKGTASLATARVGVGVGEATASPCAYSLIGDWFPQRMRATALAIYSSGLFVGSGLSLLIGGLIVERWNAAWPHDPPLGLAGWQVAFLAVGAPGLMLAAWVWSLREPPRENNALSPAEVPTAWRSFVQEVVGIIPPFTLIAAARGGGRNFAAHLAVVAMIAAAAVLLGRATGSTAQFAFVAVGAYAVYSWAGTLQRTDPATFDATFRSVPFVAIVLAYGAVCFTGYTVSYWAAPYAERTFGLSKVELGWWLGAPAALGGFLGVILGGYLADQLHRFHPTGRLWVLLIGLAVPVPLVLIGYSSADAGIFLACSFGLQMTTSSALGAAAAASQALVQPHMRGTATAIFFLGATLIGLALGPFTAGYVSEVSGALDVGVKANLAIVPLGLVALATAIARYLAAYGERSTGEPVTAG